MMNLKKKKQLSKKQNLKKGITLIALVITIIVLLILAGVSIATLTGDNGVLTKTAKAKGEARGASVQEARNLWKIDQKIDVETESATAQTLDELLGQLEEQGLLTAEEVEIIQETGKITIDSTTIVFESIADYVKIGDYVEYIPQNETVSYTFKAQYNGDTSDKIRKQDNLQWRVMNIEGDVVELISSVPTSQYIFFKGVLGYNNGVYLLNDFCGTLYSNVSIGATARSLNIEDIEDKMDLKVWNYHNYTAGATNTKYGGSYIYTDDNLYYPYQWTQEQTRKSRIDENLIEGTLEKSEQKVLTTESYSQANISLETEHTYWYRSDSAMKSNFKEADTRECSKKDSMYYELFINNGSNYPNYWLASRIAAAGNASYAVWGLRNIGWNMVGGTNLFFSDDIAHSGTGSCFVRPVVSIPTSIIDIDTEYDENTGWKLK